jgi:hypothetical protein
MNYLNIPFDAEDFGISLARRASLEHLRGCSRGALSPLDTDESEPNKFNTHFEAWITPLPPMEVHNVFLPTTSAPVAKAFAVDFLLGFKALARASSRAEVCAPEQDDLLPQPRLPEVFLAPKPSPGQ